MHKLTSAVGGTKSQKRGKKKLKIYKGIFKLVSGEGGNGVGMQVYSLSFYCIMSL